MKRVILFSLIAVFLFASTSALAVNINRDTNIAIKVDWLEFTDDLLEDIEVDSGLYYAIDMRSPLTEFFDIGMEIGYAKFSDNITGPRIVAGKGPVFNGTWGHTIKYIPVEVNLSHSRPFGNIVCTFGAGVSGNYVSMDIDMNETDIPFTLVDDESAWLLGAQTYFDISYEGESWYFGIDGKYQVVKDKEFFNSWLDVNLSNWRAGIHVGKHF